MIKLTAIATYKDGGSKDFIGSDGKKYWQCFMLGRPDIKEKIFNGSRKGRGFKLAEGEFTLMGSASDQNPVDGDLIFNPLTEIPEIYYGRKWTEVASQTLSNKTLTTPMLTTPTLGNLSTIPTNCKNCGAVLHTYKCEYCSSQY